MITRPISEDGSPGVQEHDPRLDRRTMVRYRLAGLLLREMFDVALQEALEARRKEEILPCDMEFVLEIIQSAERRGHVGMDRENFPGESLAKALGIAPGHPVSQ